VLIKSEFDIQFYLPFRTSVVAMLHLHPSVEPRIIAADELTVAHAGPAEDYEGATPLQVERFIDTFGNRCSRFVAPMGAIRLTGSNVVDASEMPDPQGFGLELTPVEALPNEVLQFLLPSRYCEVDRLGGVAHDLFGRLKQGWEQAAAIRDWVNERVTFNYLAARPTKTALDVFTERVGVCRDFQHLAVTLSRCLNIPARYVTGYLGDIRVPYTGPGDFSAWYQVWLDGRWWNMDARHNVPRLGRVLVAIGRDATDVAITTSYAVANLTHFYVESNEIGADGRVVPLPLAAATQQAEAGQAA
jgi:transglutaminase-like putative cysteine protease